MYETNIPGKIQRIKFQSSCKHTQPSCPATRTASPQVVPTFHFIPSYAPDYIAEYYQKIVNLVQHYENCKITILETPIYSMKYILILSWKQYKIEVVNIYLLNMRTFDWMFLHRFSE
jgi:hypothetical protein